MILLRILLMPFLPVFYLVLRIRHLLYDFDFIEIGYTPTESVGVGNLKLGGTGKTPFTNLLLSHLPYKNRIALLSRGYGRKTKGFIENHPETTANEIGDEPKMTSLYHPEITVCACEDRVYGASRLLSLHPSINFIILDDAFQHRKIKPTKDILLTEYNYPYFKDHLFPLGNLRDLRISAKRAHIIVVTKTPPQLSIKEMDNFASNLKLESYQHVFFSSIEYAPLRQMRNNRQSTLKSQTNVITVAAIASSTAFENEISSRYNLIKRFQFKDHYNYNVSELEKIAHYAEVHSAKIITTAKDAAKWINIENLSENFISRVYIQDIQYKILDYKGSNINTLIADIKK